MKKFITHFFRLFIGALFIFSGFVKLVDPIGSAYKFEEYFGADVLNLEFLIPFALPFAILLIVIELVLGVAILIGFRTKTTLWSLLGITMLFLFLTWYSAFYNKVTDCGCFGDAIKLSPWATFYKNIVFIILIVWMLFNQKLIKPFFSKNSNHWLIFISVFSSLYIVYHVLTYLPLIDFRPYAIGKNIREGMKYKNDGELPPVHDFYLESDTADLTDTILNAPKVVLIVANDLVNSEKEAWKDITEFANKAKKKGYLVYALSSSSSDLVHKTIRENQLPFEILFCDGTTLKTMIRANPGVLILNESTIKAKNNWRKINKIKL